MFDERELAVSVNVDDVKCVVTGRDCPHVTNKKAKVELVTM